jgi:hypothetical protein
MDIGNILDYFERESKHRSRHSDLTTATDTVFMDGLKGVAAVMRLSCVVPTVLSWYAQPVAYPREERHEHAGSHDKCIFVILA